MGRSRSIAATGRAASPRGAFPAKHISGVVRVPHTPLRPRCAWPRRLRWTRNTGRRVSRSHTTWWESSPVVDVPPATARGPLQRLVYTCYWSTQPGLVNTPTVSRGDPIQHCNAAGSLVPVADPSRVSRLGSKLRGRTAEHDGLGRSGGSAPDAAAAWRVGALGVTSATGLGGASIQRDLGGACSLRPGHQY